MTRRDTLLAMLSGSVLPSRLLRSAVAERTVVLSFDDAVSSHYHFVAPLLRKYRFGGTFFVCEFPPDFDDKKKYMTWEQIKELHEQGFEIGSHTWIHTHVTELTRAGLEAQLRYVEEKLQELNIPRPSSFAYPAYVTSEMSVQVLAERGYRFARAGGSRTYKPGSDNPLLIPSFSTTGPDKQRVLEILKQARDGNIVVFTIHGVPDYAHPNVTTPPELFEDYLRFMKKNGYHVIAVRDLGQYIAPSAASTL